MKTEKLFGTDGIRGEVGRYPLTQEAVFNLGRSLAVWLKQRYRDGSELKVLIGKDTRQSGEQLEAALIKGAKLFGLKALRVGICPTPTVAYLTSALGANLGLAISASHNPGSDNGIKFFDARGYKLFSDVEGSIEQVFFDLADEQAASPVGTVDLPEELDCLNLYKDFAKDSLNSTSLSGLKIILDCAFGSFSKIAPEVFSELGAEVIAINNQPDGNNINVNCGTLYPQGMAEQILQQRADLGIAFDGDGDRVIIADEKGNILDGDFILAVLAQHLRSQNRLPEDTVICTQMSNIGLELFLRDKGIKMIRADVGDKYVLREMLKHKVNLGGEQSGHIILLERTTTGDGLIAALELIKVLLKAKKSLSKLAVGLERFPQTLVNIKIKEKRPFAEVAGFNEELKRCRQELGPNGRILVRYSGTEKLARVMVEARSKSEVTQIADSLAGIIKAEVGEGQ